MVGSGNICGVNFQRGVGEGIVQSRWPALYGEERISKICIWCGRKSLCSQALQPSSAKEIRVSDYKT